MLQTDAHMRLLGLRKPNFMKNAIERFDEQLSSRLGSKSIVYRQKSESRKLPNVFSLIYKNTPSKGLITACTFGVSFGDQEVWGNEKIELFLQMQSEDENWGHVLAFLGNHLREDCPFDIGQIIHFGQKIVDNCDMTDFLAVPVEPETGIDNPLISISKKQSVKLVRLVPIYNKEVHLIKSIGWLDFLQRLSSKITDSKRSILY